MKFAALAVLACVTLLAGCTCAERYTAGQNYGASDPTRHYPIIGNPTAGEVACGNRQTTDGYLPICPPPNDGDEWDTRNRTF